MRDSPLQLGVLTGFLLPGKVKHSHLANRLPLSEFKAFLLRGRVATKD